MTSTNLEVDSKGSNHDMYANVLLSTMLDKDIKNEILSLETPLAVQPNSTLPIENQKLQDQKQEIFEDTNNSVIWVPADKHPKIAPNAFAAFIKTQGVNTPTRRSSTLHRRKSILSQSLSKHNYESEAEDEHLNRSLSEKKRLFLEKVLEDREQLKEIDEKIQIFDRNSVADDHSKIIAPRSDKSLLRRSALSARGRNRKTISEEDRLQAKQRRSLSQKKSYIITETESKDDVKSIKSNHSWDKLKGVSLFDQPVNLGEWIDLGTASLHSDDSQRGILSRVHDAESQLRSQLDIDIHTDQVKESENIEEISSNIPKEVDLNESIEIPLVVPNVPTPPSIQKGKKVLRKDDTNDWPKRPGIVRSETELSVSSTFTNSQSIKSEKKSSWLGGLFNNNKSENNNQTSFISTIKPTTNNDNTNNISSSSPLSGLSGLFNRSLSIKSTPKQNNDTLTKTKTNHNNTTIISNNTTIKPIYHNNNNNNNTTTTTTTTDTIVHYNHLENHMNESSGLDTLLPSDSKFYNSNRLPIHVERAIYRLSHVKLSDPRRPLRQQVLISNLMFWYLSIQQHDMQNMAQKKAEAIKINTPDLQQKKIGKISRLFSTGKKRRQDPAQTNQNHPTKDSASSKPPPKPTNVQFSLPQIPSHDKKNGHKANTQKDDDDDMPLSYYRH